MTLSPGERSELERLLWQGQSGLLTPADEGRLRVLVAKQNPAAQGLPVAQLITAGLVVLGALLLLRALTKD
ncbi:MAG: hypothetical protein ABR562_08590 [Thermoplasmatota archaeon]